MKFEFNKSAWTSIEEGEKNCYLMANGLGGYNSMNLVGGLTRGDQALFMAAKKAPNVRWNMITGVLETLKVDGTEYVLTSQRMQGKPDFEGFRYLESFCFDNYPDFELYLARYSNQWGFLLFFSAMWRLFGLFGMESIFMPMVIVQAALYVPGVLSALSAARRARGVRAELLLLALLAGCLPLYLAAGVLYTDTFSLPFVLIALDLALRVMQEKDAKRRLCWAAACGLGRCWGKSTWAPRCIR